MEDVVPTPVTNSTRPPVPPFESPPNILTSPPAPPRVAPAVGDCAVGEAMPSPARTETNPPTLFATSVHPETSLILPPVCPIKYPNPVPPAANEMSPPAPPLPYPVVMFTTPPLPPVEPPTVAGIMGATPSPARIFVKPA